MFVVVTGCFSVMQRYSDLIVKRSLVELVEFLGLVKDLIIMTLQLVEI